MSLLPAPRTFTASVRRPGTGMQQITVSESFLDRLIGYFSPSRAVSRMRSRINGAYLDGPFAPFGAPLGGIYGRAALGSHEGAKSNRAMAGWLPYGYSPDTDIIYDLPVLRQRSRDMYRNNPLAGGAVLTNRTAVIGQLAAPPPPHRPRVARDGRRRGRRL